MTAAQRNRSQQAAPPKAHAGAARELVEKRPLAGYGLGLRPEYYSDILSQRPPVDWFEIISENYMVEGGKALYNLDRIRADYPLVMHGVSLSIGASDPLNMDYLKRLKGLAERVEPAWISDHLCWTGHGGHNFHDLFPLPYNGETVAHVAERILRVQDFLGRRLVIENVSSYLTYNDSEMSEWAFLTAVAEAADCLILLDINNVYVSAVNHRFDPLDYLDGVPAERIAYFHLAGHMDYGDYIIDTHDHPICPPVWELYQEAVARFGPVPTTIERDDHMPPFAELLAELAHARTLGAINPPQPEPVG